MKAICIPAFNRVGLLSQTLDSIWKNKTNGWRVFINLDGNGADKVVSKMPIDIVKMPFQMGCSLNSFNVCQRAILKGAESILYMDDDILLSPDALQLCDWYLNLPRDSNDLGIGLCRKDGNDPSRPNSIIASDTHMGHFGQGWCFTRQMWFNFILRHWWSRDPGQPDAYDWALCLEAQKQGKVVIRPRFARAQHAGAVGFHGHGLGVFPEEISDGKHTNYVIEP